MALDFEAFSKEVNEMKGIKPEQQPAEENTPPEEPKEKGILDTPLTETIGNFINNTEADALHGEQLQASVNAAIEDQDTTTFNPDAVDDNPGVDPEIQKENERGAFAPFKDLIEEKADDKDAFFSDQATAIRASSIFRNLQTNDEKAAAAHKIGRDLGIPPQLLLDDENLFKEARYLHDEYEKEKHLAGGKPYTLKNFYDSHPSIRGLADMDEEQIALALRDIDSVDRVHGIINSFTTMYDQGTKKLEHDKLWYKVYDGSATDDQKKQAEQMYQQLNNPLNMKSMPIFMENPLEYAVAGFGQSLPQMLEDIGGSVVGGVMGASLAGAAALFATATTAGTMTVPSMSAAAAFGWTWGQRIGGTGTLAQLEIGSSYAEKKHITDDKGKPLYTDEELRVPVAVEGVVNAIIEDWSNKTVAGMILPKTAIEKQALKETTAVIFEQAEASASLSAAWNKFAKDRAGDFIKGTVAESGEEFAQRGTSDLANNLLVFNTGKGEYVSTYDMARNATGAFIESLPTSALFAGSSTAGGTVTGIGGISRQMMAASNIGQYAEKSQQTILGMNMLASLQAAVQNSKLKDLAPDVQRKIINQQAAGTGFSMVYIDTKSALEKENGMNNLQKVADAAGYDQETLQTAIEQGNLSVPLEVYAQSEADPDLLSSVSFSAEAPSIEEMKRDIKESFSRQQEIMKDTIEKQKKLMDQITSEYFPNDKEGSDMAAAAIFENAENPAQGLKTIEKRVLDDRFSILQPALDILTQRISSNENVAGDWYDKFQKTFKRQPSEKELIDMATALMTGDENAPQVPGWSVDPEISTDVRDKLAAINRKLAIVDRTKEKISTMTKAEIKLTEGMTPEAYSVYKTLWDKLSHGPGTSSRAARMNAILLARHADIYARVITEKTGRKYTAKDYYQERLAVAFEGEQQGDFNQNNAVFEFRPDINPIIRDQMAAIKHSYTNEDGSMKDGWMKAPNGEDTNLTEEQWLLVRTNGFKRWFGNWNYNPDQIIETGDAIPLLTGIIPDRKQRESTRAYKKRRTKAVREWLEKNIVRDKYQIASDGAELHVTTMALDESNKNVSTEKISMYPYLNNVFKRAVYLGFEKADQKHYENKHVDGQDVYISSVSINDGSNIIDFAIKIKVDVLSVDKHLRYNTHKEYQAQNRPITIEVDEIKKEDQENRNLPDLPVGNHSLLKPSKYSLAELVKIVNENTEKDDQAKLKIALDKNLSPISSKVVDENGEPLMVYHGTPLNRIQANNVDTIHIDGFGDLKRIRPPFDTFKGGNYGGLIFFTDDETHAKNVADQRSMEIPDDENGNEMWTEEGYVYDVFLNARNPFIAGDNQETKDILDSLPVIKKYDFSSMTTPEEISKEEALEILKGDNSWMVAEQPEFLAAIKEKGYDSLQAKDEKVGYIAVFGPNQIKSATKNNGNFDVNDDNIYHQIIGQQGAGDLDKAQEVTTRLDNLNVARQMETSGKDAKTIRLATGWERGADGLWRYEIKEPKFTKEFYNLDHTTRRGMKIVDALKGGMDNELLQAYPELAKWRVRFTVQGRKDDIAGWEDFEKKQIVLSEFMYAKDNREDHFLFKAENYDHSLEGVFMHEIQHAIQDIEGFAKGTDVRENENEYHRNAGETEARNVTRRMDMTWEQRQQTLLAETEDVAREDQIFLRGENTKADYISDDFFDDSLVNRILESYNQSVWHGTPSVFDIFDLLHIGEGEGAQVHGWGLYFTADREIAQKRYRERLTRGQFNSANLTIKGIEYTASAQGGVIERKDGSPLSPSEQALSNLSIGHFLDKKDRTDGVETFRDWVTRELEHEYRSGEKYIEENNKIIQEALSTPKNPASDELVTKIHNVYKETADRIGHLDATTYEKYVKDVEGKLTEILGQRKAASYLKKLSKKGKGSGYFGGIYEKNRDLKLAKKFLEETGLENISYETVEPGTLFNVEIPENDVLLDEQKTFSQQPEAVKEGIKKAIPPSKEVIAKIKKERPEMWHPRKVSVEEQIADEIHAAKERDRVLKQFGMDLEKEERDRELADRIEKIKQNGEAEYSAPIEIIKDILEDKDDFDYYEVCNKIVDTLKGTMLSDEALKIAHTLALAVANETPGALNDLKGREIYTELFYFYGISKEVSLKLNECGIKGITYDGYIDGRCFVIFDDKVIEIIERYNQEIKGSTTKMSDGQRLVQLFSSADESTFLHEMGHVFLMDLEDLAKIDDVSAAELAKVKEWAAWKKGEKKFYRDTPWYKEFADLEKNILAAEEAGDMETADRLKKTWMHERFARGFEMYLKDGKAPAAGLRAVFRKFAAFLRQVYTAFTSDGARPSAEVEAIMARMIATDEEVEAMALDDQFKDIEKAGGEKLLTETERETYERWLSEAKEEAKEKLYKIVMADLQKKKEAEYRQAMKEEEAKITTRMEQEPIYLARAIIAKLGGDVEKAMPIILDHCFPDRQAYEAADKAAPALADAVKQELENWQRQQEEQNRSQITEDDVRIALETATYTRKAKALETAAMSRKLDTKRKITDKVEAAIQRAKDAIEALPDDTDLVVDKYTKRVKQTIKRINEIRFATKWNNNDFQKLDQILKSSTKEEMAQLLEDFTKNMKQQKLNISDVEKANEGRLKLYAEMAAKAAKEQSIYNATNSGNHRSNQRKAERRVLQMIKAGRFDMALQQSQQAALSAAMAQAAERTKEEVDRLISHINQQLNARTVKLPAKERYWHKHIAFLLGIGMNDAQIPVLKEGQQLGSLQDLIAGYKDRLDLSEDYDANEVIEFITSTAAQQSYVALTLDQLKQAAQLLDIIYKCGKDAFELKTVKGKTIESVVDEILDDEVALAKKMGIEKRRIQDNIGGLGYNEWLAKIPTVGECLAKAGQNYLTIGLKPEKLIELLGKTAYQYIFGTFDTAANKEADMMAQAVKDIQNLLKDYSKKERRTWKKRAYKLDMPDGETVELSKENILAMAMNMGTELNRQRLYGGLLGEKYNGPENIAKINKLIFDTMTKKDWKLAQGIWDYLHTYWADTVRVEQELNGMQLQPQEPMAFSVFANGEKIDLQGGYYPIAYNPDKNNRTSVQAQDDVAKQMGGSAKVLGTGRSHTKARVEADVFRELQLTLDIIPKHLNQVIHNITTRIAARDVYRLLNHQELSRHISDQLGAPALNMLRKWALDVWTQLPEKDMAANVLEQAMGALRRNSTFAIMAYRIWPVIENISNYAVVADKLGHAKTLSAIADFFGNFKEYKLLLEKSVMMRNRINNMDRDIRSQPGLFEVDHPAVEMLKEHGYDLMTYSDLMFSAPLWCRAYKDVFHLTLKEVNDANENNKRTVQEAQNKLDMLRGQHLDADNDIREWYKEEKNRKNAGQVGWQPGTSRFAVMGHQEFTEQLEDLKNRKDELGAEIWAAEADFSRATELNILDETGVVKEAERQAAAKADAVVRDAFGSGRTVDLPAVQRSYSELVKAMTSFYSFFNTVFNSLYFSYIESRYGRQPGKDAGTWDRIKQWAPLARAVMHRVILLSFIGSVLKMATKTDGDDDRDKYRKVIVDGQEVKEEIPWLQRFLKVFAKNTLGTATGSLYGVRDLANIAMNLAFDGTDYGRGLNIVSTPLRSIEEGMRTVKLIAAKSKKDLEIAEKEAKDIARYKKMTNKQRKKWLEEQKYKQPIKRITWEEVFRHGANALTGLTAARTGVSSTIVDSVTGTIQYLLDTDNRYDATWRNIIWSAIFDKKPVENQPPEKPEKKKPQKRRRQ